MRTRWKPIARVIKTHARSGEAVVASVHGLPPVLRSGMEIALVPPELKAGRFFTVERAGEGDGTSQLVSFKGVDTISAAQELVGKTVLVREEDLPEGFELLDRDSLVGSAVSDASLGYLGTLSEVIAGPSQDVFVIEGARSNLLVPVLPEFVVDVCGRAILLDLPAGSILEEVRRGA